MPSDTYVSMSIPSSHAIVLLLLILGSGLVTGVIASGTDKTIWYTTNFTHAEDWKTNSDDRYYLDNETGRYHYLIEGGTGSYAAVALPNPLSGPFILEFDVTPDRTDDGATFRFGIGTEKKDSQKGPLVMAELANKKDGRLFYLKTVSKGNALKMVGSSPSTGGPGATVRFEDGRTYHIRMTYYEGDGRVSIVVQESGSPAVIFTSFTTIAGKAEDLTHLFLTSLGDGVPGPQAEGFIDNITLSIPVSLSGVNPTETATPEPTEVPPTLAPDLPETAEPTPVITPSSTQISLPSPPTTTPTPTPQSGSQALMLLFALGAGTMLVYWRR